jgi:3-oxoacyl-[acyl-carrier protein] reductase
MMLAQKHILITGANRGIGKAVAEVCVGLGANVYLAGRNEVELESLAAELGESATAFCYDITDPNEVKQAFRHLQQHVGCLDGLVNNAGIMLDASIAMTLIADLQQQLQVNTVAAFQHAQLASRLMTKNRQGCIINLCSIVGEQGSAGQSAYATSKAALSGMTKAMAKELGALGIRVNGVAPGMIDTDLVSHYSPEKRQKLIESISLRRVGETKEVADLVSFLLSDHAAYITGQIIAIDGGMSL